MGRVQAGAEDTPTPHPALQAAGCVLVVHHNVQWGLESQARRPGALFPMGRQSCPKEI